MPQEFAIELKAARRKAGLTQEDCAHLLSVHPSKISLLEHGKLQPTVREVCTLSIIYGRSFEQFFDAILNDAHALLRERFATLPNGPTRWIGRFNRQNTLNQLAARLEDARNDDDAA